MPTKLIRPSQDKSVDNAELIATCRDRLRMYPEEHNQREKIEEQIAKLQARAA